MSITHATGPYKAIIGASGAIALVILKLIDAQFFYPDLTGKVAIVSYLTYCGYLILGIIVATCFSEDGEPEQVRKNAFVYGLLAPSILLAILKAPTAPPSGGTEAATKTTIPSLMSLIVPSLLAQPTVVPRTVTPNVIVVNDRDLGPTTSQAFQAAIGRPVASADHVYVIGSTNDRSKAVASAEAINRMITDPTVAKSWSLHANVLQVEGTNTFYVVAGTFQSRSDAQHTEQTAKSAAVELLARHPNEAATAKLLHQGVVVDSRALTQKQ